MNVESPQQDPTPARKALIEAASELSVLVRDYAQSVPVAGEDERVMEKFELNRELRDALVKFGRAQFDLTGTSWPLGLLEEFAMDDDGADEIDEDEGLLGSGSAISVYTRQDFELTSEGADRAALSDLVAQIDMMPFGWANFVPTTLAPLSRWTVVQEASPSPAFIDRGTLDGIFPVVPEAVIYWSSEE